MKKTGLILLTMLIFLVLVQCKSGLKEGELHKKRIVLVNPDRWDVESIVNMIQSGIIKIDYPELQVIYYAQNEYGPQTIKGFIQQEKIPFIQIEIVQGNLNPDNLYQINDCSAAFKRIFKNSEGALFFGGADFPPQVYGQKTNLLTNIATPNRHYFELSFLFHLLGGYQEKVYEPLLDHNPDYVIYGFCLGMQSMNVASGGTMFQDIPSEVYALKYVEDVLNLDTNKQHTNYWRRLAPNDNLSWCNFHQIKFFAEGFFTNHLNMLTTDYPYVCSSHHQAVKDVGMGFEVVATSIDGKIVESIAHTRYKNVLGVQFHPETFNIYAAPVETFKLSPSDTSRTSEYEFLKHKDSLEFHKKFWNHFSRLFSE